jgi:hypothetical protein
MRMAKPKYLQQIDADGQGTYVYVFTDELAKRMDMRRITEEDAAKILAGQRKTKSEKLAEEGNRATKIPEPATQEENPVLDEVDTEIEPDQRAGDEGGDKKPRSTKTDPEISSIRSMTKKNQVEQYVLEHFGVDIDRRLPLARLKKIAIDHRKTQLKATV